MDIIINLLYVYLNLEGLYKLRTCVLVDIRFVIHRWDTSERVKFNNFRQKTEKFQTNIIVIFTNFKNIFPILYHTSRC